MRGSTDRTQRQQASRSKTTQI